MISIKKQVSEVDLKNNFLKLSMIQFLHPMLQNKAYLPNIFEKKIPKKRIFVGYIGYLPLGEIQVEVNLKMAICVDPEMRVIPLHVRGLVDTQDSLLFQQCLLAQKQQLHLLSTDELTRLNVEFGDRNVTNDYRQVIRDNYD